MAKHPLRPLSKPGSKILTRVRRICLALPDTTEKIAWGTPTFRVGGKIFVMFADEHHKDGRVAVWCMAAPGVQQSLVAADPEHFFSPPYVGKGGWIGICLNRAGLDWSLVNELIHEAHRTRSAG